VEAACPPVKALLHIMAFGEYEGKTVHDPSIRAMFTRESMMASNWYRERLQARQRRDVELWTRHAQASEAGRGVLERVSSPAYLEELVGTIGADPCTAL